uniref:Ras-GEF domain-containing protein n=1 Tax=Caenorhabditis tropicalis TaxID=1561998 RepID=A0A1I7TLE9_9PELO
MFPKLEHLAVRGFKVTQPFKPKSLVFNQHASIRILDIMASTLNSLDELENLVNLERLIMSKVKLANSKLCPLNKLTKLKYLDLSDSRLNWFEPNRYYEFDLSTLASPSLEILDISYTRKKLENFWQLEQSNPKLNSVFAFYSNVRCHSVSNVTLYTHKFLHTCIHVLSHYSEYGLTGHVAQALRILTASYKFTRERYEPFLDVFMKVNYECRMDNAVMIQMLNLLWTCDRSEMLSSQQRQALVEHTFDNLSTFRSDSHCTEKNRCALRMINNWFEQFPDELNQKIAKQMLKWANCSRFDWFVYGDTLCQFIRFLDPYDIKRLGDTNGLAMNLCENVSLRRTNIAFKELTKFSTKFCDELVKLKYSYLYRIERNSYIGYLLRVFDDSSSVYQFEIIRNILTKINIPDDLKMEKLDLVALNLKLLRQEDEEENAFNHRDDTINSFILYNKLYLCAGAICASICSSRPPVAAYTLVDICTIPINQISMDFVSFVGHEEFILGKALVSQRDEPVLYGLYTIRLLLRDSEFIHVFNKLKMGQIIEKLKNDGSRTQELGGRIRELAATILETVAFKNRNRS